MARTGTGKRTRQYNPGARTLAEYTEAAVQHTRGQYDAGGKIIPDTFEGEFRRSLDNLKKVLEGAGSDLRHVVQTRNYVRDPANLARYNELYREYFSAPFPTRTTVTNCLPPTLHYEVECVAVVRE